MSDEDLVAAGPAAPEPEPMWTAVLDGDGVLIAFDTSGKGEGVTVPVNCDLRIGGYRWTGETFLPIRETPASESLPPPDAMRAIALFVDAVSNRQPIPKLCSDWARWYLSTPDGMGA